MIEALHRAISIAGGQSAFARICGISQPAVWLWVRKGKPLPAEHVLKVEAETGVSRHELRPDLYPVGAAA
jgi:DNA-binding transcriptional regulator YdaS (Cro superfamily)